MCSMLSLSRYFNPRLHEGGDYMSQAIKQETFQFQSTPPRRRRQAWEESNDASFIISIHASKKEATLIISVTHIPYIISIHASKKEATLYILSSACSFHISIHASKKEATMRGYSQKALSEFQSTPPRRRRQQHIVIPQLSCTYLVSTTFLSTIFSFISQYIVLFFFF